jgi:hypothetical protein
LSKISSQRCGHCSSQRLSGLKSAICLLIACAYLAPESIPETIFIADALSLGPVFQALAANPLEFNAALQALLASSLIVRDPTTHTLTVHRLLQAILKEYLPFSVRHQWVARVILTLAQLFPASNEQYGYVQVCERLLPHRLLCITPGDQWIEDETQLITLMNHIASYCSFYGRAAEAKPLYQRVLVLGEHALGAEHPLANTAL